MKTMKRLASLLLAVIMVLGLATTAFATEVTTGTITIDNAIVDHTYSIYQIFELDSYDSESGKYAYTVADAWDNFVKTPGAMEYVKLENGYVTWLKNNDEGNPIGGAEFAALAIAYAEANNIDAVASKKAGAPAETPDAKETILVFENLDLGYYLVDSTVGALCSLDTTNPGATIQEKNEAPIIKKEVQEDSTQAWGETNDADIFQQVDFEGTVTVLAGAENYSVEDVMSKGLTFNGVNCVKVFTVSPVAEGAQANPRVEIPASNYTVKENVLIEGADTEDTADDKYATFVVDFKNEFTSTLEVGTQIIVTYSGTLNEDAVIGLPGNPNDIRLKYGDENEPHYTPWDETITYTWDLKVVKYTVEGEKEVVLAGAVFKLTRDETGEDVIKFHALGDNKYEVCADAECTDEHVTEITTDATGTFLIEGLDTDSYYLHEIKAPAGYNKLSGPIEIVITGATETEDETPVLEYTTIEKKVLNQSGPELPSTGGIGTTIFYIVGGILVLAAVVLLVTKKRMSHE